MRRGGDPLPGTGWGERGDERERLKGMYIGRRGKEKNEDMGWSEG